MQMCCSGCFIWVTSWSRESNSDLVQRNGAVYYNTVKTGDALEEWKSCCGCLGFPGKYLVSDDGNDLIIQRKPKKPDSRQM